MKRVWLGLGAVGVGLLVLLASVFAVSELGAEVVTLRTFDASGEPYPTRLWIVDDGASAWLRAGVPESSWLARIEANPDVVVLRGDRKLPFRAVAVRDAETRERIHALVREKYGWSDRFISALRDGSRSVPVRLDPRPQPEGWTRK